MTHKDFETIAYILRTRVRAIIDDAEQMENIAPDLLHARIAHAFLAELRLTNPNFNDTRFLKASGVVETGA